MVLEVIFWILLILSGLGFWAPANPPYINARWGIAIILFAILGLKVFHNPLTH